MAQKQKKYNLDIDEEKDIFLSSLNKKIRNNRKKLEQIDELSKRDKTTLKAEQIEKINSKSEVKESIKYIETIKGLYYEALKTAKEEGKALPVPVEGKKAQKEETAQEEAQAEPVVERVEESEEERAARAAQITHQNLSKVINLVNFAQFFRSQSNVQGFRQAYDAHKINVESVPDFESFYEFYAKIFTFSESDRLSKLGEKTSQALHELESYINGSEDPALRNKSYAYLQKIVETVVVTPFFRDHNAEVGFQVRQTAETSAIGSIGSELRKGHEHQERVEAPVEHVKASPAKTPLKEKHISPEKEVRAEQKPQETTKGWEHVEDEESEGSDEEERGEEQEEQQGGEEQKKNPDDEFITVRDKRKEKKEEVPQRGGNRPYRGGQGGYRKYRPEGEHGNRRPRTEQGGEEVKNENGGEQQPRGERRPYRGGYQGEQGQGRPYRGNREGGEGGYRGNREGGEGGYRGGYQGEGGNRSSRGGYRGGYRGGKRSDRPAEEYVKKETATPAPEQKS